MYINKPKSGLNIKPTPREKRIFLKLFKEQYPLTKEDYFYAKEYLNTIITWDIQCFDYIVLLNLYFKEKYGKLTALDKRLYNYLLLEESSEILVSPKKLYQELKDEIQRSSDAITFKDVGNGFSILDTGESDIILDKALESVKHLDIVTEDINTVYKYYAKDIKGDCITIGKTNKLNYNLSEDIQKQYNKTYKKLTPKAKESADFSYNFDKIDIVEYIVGDLIFNHCLQNDFGVALLKNYIKSTRRNYNYWYSVTSKEVHNELIFVENQLKELLIVKDKKKIKELNSYYVSNFKKWWD